MNYADDRAHAIALLRSHIRKEVKSGQRAAFLLHEISSALAAVKQEIAVEFDIPGVRYWHLAETNEYWVTMPGERQPTDADDIMSQLVFELTRHEFTARQSLHGGYEDRI